jgi:hypothetical protein
MKVMSGKWESRERNTRRIALIVSIVLHLCVLIALSSRSGMSTLQRDLQDVFRDTPAEREVADVKV